MSTAFGWSLCRRVGRVWWGRFLRPVPAPDAARGSGLLQRRHTQQGVHPLLAARTGCPPCQAEWALHHIAKNLQGWTRRRATAPPTGPDDTDPGPNRSTDLYGTGKQGARFGYTGARGYHPLLATLASTGEVLDVRMRGGNAGAVRGAGSFVRETISRICHAGATGKLTFRADSAFYSQAFVTACQDHDVAFSVTGDKNCPIRRAFGQIDDDAWVPIAYWLDGGADVAETTCTAFKGTTDQVGLRLLVRRVRPTPGSQLALAVVFDYHAILTDRDGSMLEVEADDRAHAVVELAIRDLKAGGLAHVPSGTFTANAAWLALAVLAHNLARWTPAADELAVAPSIRDGTRQDRGHPGTDLTALRRPTVRADPNDPATRTQPGPVGMPRPGSETPLRPQRRHRR